MRHTLQKAVFATLVVAPALALFPALASADTVSVNFEPPTYTVGNINGQDGWLKTGTFDVAVFATSTLPASFGTQSLRISDSVTSGSFGDQTFSKPLVNEVGETTASSSGQSGGVRQPHFETQFDIASLLSTLQTGMHISVSPDRGDGSRMSYLRFEDQADGIHVFFDDVTDLGPVGTGATFNETDIATISRSPHTIKLTMDTLDGPGNDVVKVYIDGVLKATGTSWENYYRFDPEQASGGNVVPTVDSLLFRESGTANPADAGNGFLIDNLSLLSGPIPTAPPTNVSVHIFKFIDGAGASTTNATTSFPMLTTFTSSNLGSATDAPFTLSPAPWGAVDQPYEASFNNSNPGANYATHEVTGGQVVGADCSAGAQYSLVGYKVGDTYAGALAAATSSSTPSFTNLQSDKYVIVLNKTCPPPTTLLKVHVLKYLNGAEATAVSAGNYQFPMTATWSASNIGSGSGNYVLGTNFGGASSAYGADTAAMSAPANYATSEVTDASSQVVGPDAQCAPGKFQLQGYKVSAISFADAATQATSTASPSFTGLTSDEYVLVYNITCPNNASLTVEKVANGGNGTFNFTSDIPGHTAFNLTTVNGSSSVTFTGITPGTYHVTEAPLAGWTQVGSECSTVTLAAGAAAVCVVDNTKNVKLGEIRGTKYEDRDGDGRLTDGDHHRLSGWTIYLDTNNNGNLDSGEPSTVTDSHGDYRFTSLTAGTYHVREVLKTGWIQTYPSSGKYDVNLSAGQVAKKKDFGNFKLGMISGTKFEDKNGNGRRNVGENGLSGWVIKLKHGNTTISTTTDSLGRFSFPNLGPGAYTLSEVMQPGWTQTRHPWAEFITSGENSTGNDFGNKHGVVTRFNHDHDND